MECFQYPLGLLGYVDWKTETRGLGATEQLTCTYLEENRSLRKEKSLSLSISTLSKMKHMN